MEARRSHLFYFFKFFFRDWGQRDNGALFWKPDKPDFSLHHPPNYIFQSATHSEEFALCAMVIIVQKEVKMFPPQELGLKERERGCAERKSVKDAEASVPGAVPTRFSPSLAHPPLLSHYCSCCRAVITDTEPLHTVLCSVPNCVTASCPTTRALSRCAGGTGRAERGLGVLRQSWGSRAAPGLAGGKAWERGALRTFLWEEELDSIPALSSVSKTSLALPNHLLFPWLT